jgi:Fe-S cluster biogenesis protein NfuA
MKLRPNDAANWIVLPPGDMTIFRFPVDEELLRQMTKELPCRKATTPELLLAFLGNSFPWSRLPDTRSAGRLWKEHRMSQSGLCHENWFVTADGRRFGGARNVPESLPGSLRSCLRLDGGRDPEGLKENEGYAIVGQVEDQTTQMYRKVTLHAARHIMADGGEVIVSPIDNQGVTHVGFVGRCGFCPNAEQISFQQLQAALPEYKFELRQEWQNWHV